MLVDLSSKLTALHKHSKAAYKIAPDWSAAHRTALYSAMTNGQWTQVRRAKLPTFQGGKECQLCFAAAGTVAHRFECKATAPDGGWARPPDGATSCINKIGQQRRRALKECALLVLQLPVPEPQNEQGWRWYPHAPDTTDGSLLWVFDGSRKFGSQWHWARTGCGVVVITSAGRFVACARATPPCWIRTSGEAEAWSLFLILREAVALPYLFTDYLGLLQAARRGTRSVTAGGNPAARVWSMIAHALDGSVTKLLDGDKLIWMPAHKSLTGSLARRKSNGSLVKPWEWRANALADLLAKVGAPHSVVAERCEAVLDSATLAIRHGAALLGAVTHAANNCKYVEQLDDGTTRTTTWRDSSQPPRGQTRAGRQTGLPSSTLPSATTCTAPDAAANVDTLCSSSSEDERSTGVAPHWRAASCRAANAAARAKETARQSIALRGAITARASASRLAPGPTAVERMAALRARVLGRANASSSSAAPL